MGNSAKKETIPDLRTQALKETPEAVREHGRELMSESINSLDRIHLRLAELKNSHICKK